MEKKSGLEKWKKNLLQELDEPSEPGFEYKIIEKKIKGEFWSRGIPTPDYVYSSVISSLLENERLPNAIDVLLLVISFLIRLILKK